MANGSLFLNLYAGTYHYVERPLLTNVRTKTLLIADKVLRMRRLLLPMIRTKSLHVADKVKVLRMQGRWNK